MLRTSVLCFAVVAGCGGGSPAQQELTKPTSTPTKQPAEESPAPPELPPDSGPAGPTEVFINPGETKTIGDISISFFRSHKQSTGGGAVGMWRLNFAKSGETDHVSYTGKAFYAEVEVFGSLVVAEDEEEAVRIVLHDSAPTPLSEEEAKIVVRKVAAERGIESASFSSQVVNGVFSMTLLGNRDRKPRVRATVGLYTKKLLSFEDVR